MRRMLAIGVLGAAICFGAGATTAAEIIAVSKQINAKTDPTDVIDETVLVEDGDGGFTAAWSRSTGRFKSATELFARSYDADLNPKNGLGKPFHGPIDSVDPTAVRMAAGGVRLVKDKAMFCWEALFVNASQAHNPEFVVRTLKNDKPKTTPLPIDNTQGFISGSRLIPLSGGRALAYWGQGSISQAWGRLFERDGTPSPTFLSIATSGYWFTRPGIFPLDRGFAAFFTYFDQGYEIYLQVYDETGAPDGGPFLIAPKNPSFYTLGGVGLADGKIAILRFVDESPVGYVTARVFNRSGKTVTPETKIVKDVTFNNALPMVALPGGDFMVALDDSDATGARVKVARFNSRLKPVGAVAATAREAGLRRSAFRLLSDGRAAVGYVVNNQRVHVAIVKP